MTDSAQAGSAFAPLAVSYGEDTHWRALRWLVIALGMAWAVCFVVVGLVSGLQSYADGSLFTYSIAVTDAWTFHWHNIPGRLLVYLYAYVPAEAYVRETGDARGGIALHGALFFISQLLGLLATARLDCSRHQTFFVFACLSTACLCPIVFGFPTEMWISHALFWPTLAACHCSPLSLRSNLLVVALTLALVLTHEAAIIFAVAIVVTLSLRGLGSELLWRCAAALVLALIVWGGIKLTFPPDDYIVDTMSRNEMNFIDLRHVATPIVLKLIAAVGGFWLLSTGLRRFSAPRPEIIAMWIVTFGLCIQWLFFDGWLHAEQRYSARSLLLLAIPALGATAAAFFLDQQAAMAPQVQFLGGYLEWLRRGASPKAAGAALILVTCVHAVELVKFANAWVTYKESIAALAMGGASNPELGDAQFISSMRLSEGDSRPSWSSTTHYLSVLVAPGMNPKQLVVSPWAYYFWISCETATANEKGVKAVPVETRRLVRIFACLHRRDGQG